jgi:ketosteroid isomerase-like protein
MSEADVLAVFDALFEAVTVRRDGAAGAALFADDDDVRMWGSEEPERAAGPAAVAELLGAIAASPATLTFQWTERRVHLEADVAWVSAVGPVLVERPGAEPVTTSYRATAIIVRRDGDWRWHTFHGTEPLQG